MVESRAPRVAHAQMELECLECVGRAVLSPRHKQRKMDYRSACTLSAHTPKHTHTHTRKPPNRRVRNPSRRRKSRLVRVYLSGRLNRAPPSRGARLGLSLLLPPPPTSYMNATPSSFPREMQAPPRKKPPTPPVSHSHPRPRENAGNPLVGR